MIENSAELCDTMAIAQDFRKDLHYFIEVVIV